MNYQNWSGCTDPKFGYGSMLDGLLEHKPAGVTFDERASVNVFMQTPYAIKGWWKGQHRVLFTMWETDTMPDSFKPWFNQFDQVLVPCEANLELFSKYHPITTCVPLGIDLAFWRSGPNPTNTTTFRFQAGGSLWHRKGLDLVVKAFNNLKLPDAELHIKAAPHAFDTPTEKLGPNIYLHRSWLSVEEQRDWFNKADCFVAPARGEGFGLMPLQAIAMGIPTIVSDTTGQKQFAHLADHIIPCGKSAAQTVGLWDEPKLKNLEAAMRDIYDRRPSRLRPQGMQQFSWKKAAERLTAAIPTGTLLDDPQWEKPTASVEVHTLRPANATIGGATYRFKAGETISIPFGAYQVLSASGAVKIGADL